MILTSRNIQLKLIITSIKFAAKLQKIALSKNGQTHNYSGKTQRDLNSSMLSLNNIGQILQESEIKSTI